MKNKTCGECRYYQKNRCMLPCYAMNHWAENPACHHFEEKTPSTNGDKIRQMSDDELVGFVDCSACIYAGHDCANQDCTEGKLAWLKQEAKDE